jgi:hypothetical protein
MTTKNYYRRSIHQLSGMNAIQRSPDVCGLASRENSQSLTKNNQSPVVYKQSLLN